MTDKIIEKTFITWLEYSILLRVLTNKIKPIIEEENIKYVLGFPRGGLPIAVHLSHNLIIPYLHKMDNDFMNRWDMGEKILVVDDLVDTGKTLKEFRSEMNLADFVSAVLYKKPWTKYEPDFYIVETDKWIVFPYENPNEIPNREVP